MADDDSDDCMLAKEALEKVTSNALLHFVGDGIQLMEYLLDTSSLPLVILLDLNMPRKDGRQALREIKSIRFLQHIPIVIFTTSNQEKDVMLSRDLGADYFITKPVLFQQWVDIMKMLIECYIYGRNNTRR
jgi:CheY-like chemotaxis protein